MKPCIYSEEKIHTSWLHFGKTKRQLGVTVAQMLLLVTALAFSTGRAAADHWVLFGDAEFVPGNGSASAVQLRSDVSNETPYGGVSFSVPKNFTIADLNHLSTDYKFTAGSCGGGSPRFQVRVTTPNGDKNIFIYIGEPTNYTGCPLGVWSNTDNLADPNNAVDATQLGGAFYQPYEDVQADFGSYPVVKISLVVDAYWAFAGLQTAEVDNVMINDTAYGFLETQWEVEHFLHHEKKAFDEQQKAEKKAFDEQQKADKKAFDEQQKIEKEASKALPKK